MSYEGYTQRLCGNGHLSEMDVFWGEDGERCEYCDSPFVFRHSVDETNGPGNRYPFEEYGWTDIWHEDHYGNKYATKRIIYEIP